MLHMGKGDLKESALSAGSHSEPINEMGDVSEILPPSAALAFSFVWAIGTSFPWHTASSASACKACSLSSGPCFYSSLSLIKFKTKPKPHHQTHGGFPHPCTPYTPISGLSINLRGLRGLAPHLAMWNFHCPGPRGVPNQAGCPGGWSWGGSRAAKAV